MSRYLYIDTPSLEYTHHQINSYKQQHLNKIENNEYDEHDIFLVRPVVGIRANAKCRRHKFCCG